MSTLHSWISEHVWLAPKWMGWKYMPEVKSVYESFKKMSGDSEISEEEFLIGLKKRGYPIRKGRARVMVGCR